MSPGDSSGRIRPVVLWEDSGICSWGTTVGLGTDVLEMQGHI